MLGRYVAGTLFILFVAMIMAPPSPDGQNSGVVVTRADAAPSSLAAVERPQSLSEPAAAMLEHASEVPAIESDATPAVLQVAEGESLTNGDVLIEASAGAGVAPQVDEPIGEPVLAGLSDPGFGTVQGNAQANQSGSTMLYVTGNRVNVRSGPSTAYRVMGAVQQGDLVELVAYEGPDWARVRMNDGDQMGYMSRRYLARSLSDG
ncbi:SH3 domain-containing protein [Tropicimonas isoalkanivorans]|uniref:SH3 domain-containing protein n=2 Tax=Tropicimonas isoalkanivorans TaxID=441112 RepID=A0A1I1PM71_9RHOB|nr:SH3 domain-containing protein [Tropicimonas isoalkanivorans]